MTEHKHTPGPWTTIDAKNLCLGYPGTVEIHAPDWDALAVVYVETCGNPSEEGEANAQLITAAPDLLEALIELADAAAEAWGEDRPCVRWAYTVIAMATGGSNV